MVFSLEHDIKVTKNHQNLLPTLSVLVAHTVHGYFKESRAVQENLHMKKFQSQLDDNHFVPHCSYLIPVSSIIRSHYVYFSNKDLESILRIF
jgi:hypothetical protein